MKCKRIAVFLTILLLAFSASAAAGIKVVNGDCPVFISNHVMGDQVIPYPYGSYSMMGLITGFTADRFPVNVTFKTLTNFVSAGRYQSAVSSLVLTDGSGKKNIGRFDFDLKFDRAGAMYTQLVDWKIAFPAEGFYCFNIFVDGTLVGYYPFYVWAR